MGPQPGRRLLIYQCPALSFLSSSPCLCQELSVSKFTLGAVTAMCRRDVRLHTPAGQNASLDSHTRHQRDVDSPTNTRRHTNRWFDHLLDTRSPPREEVDVSSACPLPTVGATRGRPRRHGHRHGHRSDHLLMKRSSPVKDNSSCQLCILFEAVIKWTETRTQAVRADE